jgi:hypothetical protein
MGYSISTRNLKCISNFAEAEAFWAAAKPWRNRPASWRPLGERRARHKRIVRINDGGGYQLVLHQTSIVTYFKNGDISLQTYSSASTQDFAWYMKPTGMKPHSVRGVMYWEFPSQEGPRFVRQSNDPLFLTYVGTGQYHLTTEPAVDYEWVLDRKKAAATRKQLSHYKRWYDMTSRLMGHDLRREISASEVAALLRNSDNLDFFVDTGTYWGPAEGMYPRAYELTGARTRVPVPYDRLPRKQR